MKELPDTVPLGTIPGFGFLSSSALGQGRDRDGKDELHEAPGHAGLDSFNLN